MPALSRRAALAALAGLALCGCRGRPRVVLYCAQDRPFAERVLKDFSDRADVDVVPKYDTEATKTVGLYNDLVSEAARPRCDVFWNNEILNTLRLDEQGLAADYLSASAEPFPAWTRPGTWHAFAGRARVLLVNTSLVAEADRPRSLLDLTHGRFRGRAVMAKPMFGTTATQAACLFDVLGDGPARRYYSELKANGLHVAPGNKMVAEWVGQGRTPQGRPAAVGVTDTDDALDEVKAGRPVAIVFPDAAAEGRMGTLFVPNTLVLVKGAPNPEAGRRLIDFLLSAEIEKQLAEGPGAQIPLNPTVKAALPPQIAAGREAKPMAVDWPRAAQAWRASQEFLTEQFAT